MSTNLITIPYGIDFVCNRIRLPAGDYELNRAIVHPFGLTLKCVRTGKVHNVPKYKEKVVLLAKKEGWTDKGIERVVVVNTAFGRTMTFFCPYCHIPHSIGVRLAGEKAPLNSGNSWEWNGSTTLASLMGEKCVSHSGPELTADAKFYYRNCHIYMKNGRIRQHGKRDFPLLKPVSEWPKIPPMTDEQVKMRKVVRMAYKEADQNINNRVRIRNEEYAKSVSPIHNRIRELRPYGVLLARDLTDEEVSELKKLEADHYNIHNQLYADVGLIRGEMEMLRQRYIEYYMDHYEEVTE